MNDAALSEYEIKTLRLLAARTYEYTSAVGFDLFAEDKETRKRNPSPQGMALAAGRFLNRLVKRGYASGYGGWRITQKGRDALTELGPA